ncbi:Uncharacterised protein [Mycobacteroides abscessus subsp. abscessus]|nr:Uncharacterised protein [Mycobacteroides abscessus subsp. abscessus]
MVGSENFALPQVINTRVPSTETSTGLFDSALVMSASRRPDTRTSPGPATSAATRICAETS